MIIIKALYNGPGAYYILIKFDCTPKLFLGERKIPNYVLLQYNDIIFKKIFKLNLYSCPLVDVQSSHD